MNGLVAYNSDSSSGDSSEDEGEVKKINNEIDESNLHLKKPSATTSVFSTSTVSLKKICIRCDANFLLR